MLVQGVVVDKAMSNAQMAKVLKDVKLAILTCPSEPPKSKTKHQLDVTSAKDCRNLREYEQEKFALMVKQDMHSVYRNIVHVYILDLNRLAAAKFMCIFTNTHIHWKQQRVMDI